jgi:hypothetical protein
MKKTRLTIYAISISLLIGVTGCKKADPQTCPSPFEYTTAGFTAHQLMDDTNSNEIPGKPSEENTWLNDTFPSGTDILCEASDPRLTTYEWSIDPDFSIWPRTIYEPVILNNKDNKIILRFDDIKQYLKTENNFTLALILRVTRPARMCKPCDEGYDVRTKLITYTGLNSIDNTTKPQEHPQVTDSMNIPGN